MEPCACKHFDISVTAPLRTPMDQELLKKYHSMDALKEAIAQEWVKIPEDHIRAACNAFPDRLMAIIKANGAPIERKWLKSKFQWFSNMFDLSFNRKILKVYCRTFSKRCVPLKIVCKYFDLKIVQLEQNELVVGFTFESWSFDKRGKSIITILSILSIRECVSVFLFLRLWTCSHFLLHSHRNITQLMYHFISIHT